MNFQYNQQLKLKGDKLININNQMLDKNDIMISNLKCFHNFKIRMLQWLQGQVVTMTTKFKFDHGYTKTKGNIYLIKIKKHIYMQC